MLRSVGPGAAAAFHLSACSPSESMLLCSAYSLPAELPGKPSECVKLWGHPSSRDGDWGQEGRR